MPLVKITKEEVLTRCLTVFLKQGYHKTTMDDLSKACGVYKGSFYYYYPSKEALMKAILEQSLEYVEKNIFSVAYDADLSADERLKRLFDTQDNMLLGYGAGCLFGNTVLETALVVPEFREPMKAFFDLWEAALVYIFKAKMSENEARKKAVETMIRVEGALVLVIIRNENQYLKGIYQGILTEFQTKKDLKSIKKKV